MTKNLLLIVLEKLIQASHKVNTKIVLIGGIATSVLGKPRATYDIDGIISLKEQRLKDFLVQLKTNGFKFDQRQPIKFIAGLPLITFYYPRYRIYVDLFVAKNKFQYEILRRARKIRFAKLNLHLISPEDLILLKLQTGREKDMEDIREIILENKSKLNFVYLKKWAKLLNVYTFLKRRTEKFGLSK